MSEQRTSLDAWKARVLAAEANIAQLRNYAADDPSEKTRLEAERDEARAEVERLRRVLRSIERDTVSSNLWLRQKAHDALAARALAARTEPARRNR